MNWTGKIQQISFKETDYGEVCNIDLGDAILTLNTSSRYFTDFACKIFNADISQEITFHPYDMEVEGGKKRQGISLQQNGVKLQNFFYGKSGTADVVLHGFPIVDEVKKEKLKKNYWKTYFAEVEAFLIEKLQELKITEPPIVEPVQTSPMDAADIPDLDPETGLPF